jgi:hypothetical protein
MRMTFDIEKMIDFAALEIARFALQHPDETFYAFTIDASLLCFNSIEAFEITLKEYKDRSPEYYETDEQIADLRQNTGDWEYQGFAEFSDETGFDHIAYNDHYEIAGGDDLEAAKTPYAIAMRAVIDGLNERDAFKHLRRSDDFYATQVEHNY